MAWIDVYNVENWNGGEPAAWYIKLLPLWTTLVGFGIGLLPGLISRIRAKNRTGKLFNQELISLKISLEDQQKEIDRYIKEFNDTSLDPSKVESLILFLLHKFDLLKSLDKTQLIKYFEKQYRDKSTQHVGVMYQMFSVLERDTERLDKLYAQYQEDFDHLTSSFVDELNALQLLAITARDKAGTNYDKDKMLVKLGEVAFSQNKRLNRNELMNFAATLPDKLLKDQVFADANHVLYKPILEFSLKCNKIVDTYENKQKKLLGIIRMSEKCYQDAHETLKMTIE